MLEVNLDEFLYNYFLINKDIDKVELREIMEIKMMVDKFNKHKRFDDMVHLDIYQDDLQCVYLDFEVSKDGHSMVKKKKPMTYDDDLIIEYMKLPQIVTDSIKTQTRIKKIKQLRNKIYKEKTPIQ